MFRLVGQFLIWVSDARNLKHKIDKSSLEKFTKFIATALAVAAKLARTFNYSRFIKSRRRWKRPARHGKGMLNVICEVGDFDCGAEDSSVLGLYALYTGKQYPTFRRHCNPSKLKPVEVGILESYVFQFKTRRNKNNLRYSGVDSMYIYIYIYIYIYTRVCV